MNSKFIHVGSFGHGLNDVFLRGMNSNHEIYKYKKMMGQIADDMIDGDCCSLCNEYFVESHGYPVACKGCWVNGCGYSKAIHNTI